jgi:hypothetical protein
VSEEPQAAKAVLSEVTASKQTSDRDMRRKRPPALSFLLRMATARRVARVLSLLALDFTGLSLAIFTALILKALVFDRVQFTPALHETERILPFAYLLTALLFARSGLYTARAQRPGLSRIVGSLFQVANTSPATTCSTARWRSRCCMSPRCAPAMSG